MAHSTGVGAYVLGLAAGFAELGAEGAESKAAAEDLVLFTSSLRDPPGAALEERARAANIHLCHRRWPVRVLNWSWHHLDGPPIEHWVPDLAVAHSPHPLLLPTRTAAQVVTVHDLYFLDAPENTFAEVRRDYPRLLWRSLERADAVICVSQATRDDLLAKAERRGSGARPHNVTDLASKTHVIANGIDPVFLSDAAGDPGLGRAERTDTFLVVGRIEPRKNPERLLEALSSEALKDVHVVWAGMPANDTIRRWFQGRVASLGLSERVTVLGYIPKEQLKRLYYQSRGLLFPSLHEGFGLPILEAMACACPVLTSNTSAMPEVAGDAAVLVDPLSVDSIVDGVLQLSDSQRRRELIQAGLVQAAKFSWSRAARQTVEVYRSVSERT